MTARPAHARATLRPRILGAFLGVVAIVGTAVAQPVEKPAGQATQATQPIHLVADNEQATAANVAMMFMARFHYRPQPLDERFSAVVFDKLVDTLDPQRTYFTAQDVQQFAPLRPRLGATIRDGDLGVAFTPINLYLNRVVEQARYASSLLPAGFDFTVDESAQVDRKDAARPSSVDDLHALWRLGAKEDWLRLKLAGQDDAAIRKTLAHRYDGLAARVAKTTRDDVFQLFMTAYAESTDPHTDYFAAAAAQEFDTEMSLSLEGIGAYLREHDEYAQVTELIPGGPAARSGALHVGDRIAAVGQGHDGAMTDVIGWRVDDVVKLVRGKSGSEVRLDVLPDERRGDAATHTIALTRKHVTIEDQAARETVLDVGEGDARRKVGVITVPSFYEDFDALRAGKADYRSLTRDVSRMLGDLSTKKVDGVLIDLRDNGGGSLTEANSMVGLFAGNGPSVQVRSANGEVDVQRSDDAKPAWSGPLGVLVNHGSASASEIFAAAIQDRGRGVIIGQPTFGKGTVQNLVDLDEAIGKGADGKLGEMKMTIAQFYRINGTSTQLLGVVPDVTFPAIIGEKDFGESTYTNALPSSHITPAPYAPDASLQPFFKPLQQGHDARVTSVPRWQLETDQFKAYQDVAARKTVSLNFDTRKAARDADLKTSAAFAARRKALDIKEGFPVDDDDASKADDGLDPDERSVEADRRRDPTKAHGDAYLQEAANVVVDEAGMLVKAVAPKA